MTSALRSPSEAIEEAPSETPLALRRASTGHDRIFLGILYGASAIVLLIISGILLFLAWNGWPALHYSGLHIITSQHYAPTGTHPSFGLLGVLVGTISIAVIALLVGVPIAVSAALMINEYAPRKIRRVLTSLVDLLAVLPSLLYGLWGHIVLSPEVSNILVWLSHHADFFPLFRDPELEYVGSIFLCGLVVGIMIIPIVTSVSREVMSQVPRDTCEAALALGGTRWGMVTDVILPFAKNGIVGGILLGLARALGETVAVLIILSQTNVIQWHILEPGGGDIPALIANLFVSVPHLAKSSMTFAGLLLFVTIFVLNLIARRIVGRPKVSIA